MSNDLLFFKMHNPTGMINQLMCVELAVGLKHETKRTTIINFISTSGESLNNFRLPIFTPNKEYNPQRKNFCSENQYPSIFDLIEYPKDIILIDENIEKFPQEDIEISGMMENYYYSNTDEIKEKEILFAEGRNKLFFEPEKNIHLKNTLGWYSRFFFDRSKELDLELSKIVFKKEYQDFANLVADSLEDFQGIHLRLTDHRKKMFRVNEESYYAALDLLQQKELPIVICTDEPRDLMVQKNLYRTILLDEYIIKNFSKEFKSLPFTDEIAFGLVCMLIMEKTKYFIGTSGSTYSAYIQRKRNQNNLPMPWEFLDKPNKEFSGPYSWNGYSLNGMQKMFWREWPESKLIY